MKHTFTIIILFLFFICGNSPSAFADLNADAEEVFSNLGMWTNSTRATIVQGQKRNMFYGGRFQAKARVRTIDLYTVQAPYVKAGCGGIDVFFGGFSFVNADELKAFMQAIAQNAIGYGFQLAIEAMCPTCNAIMKDLAKMANRMRDLFRNSCDVAKLGVDTLKSATPTLLENCKKMEVQDGTAEDRVEANTRCLADGRIETQTTAMTDRLVTMNNQLLGRTNDENMEENNAKVTGNQEETEAEQSAVQPDMNITFNALLQIIPGNSPDNRYERELMMSLFGYIYTSATGRGSDIQYHYVPPTLNYAKLLKGRDSFFAGMDTIKLFQCSTTNPGRCEPASNTITTIDVTATYESFYSRLLSRLNAVRTAIENNSDIETNTAILDTIAAIDRTPILPITRKLVKDGNISFLEQYYEAVAVYYADEIIKQWMKRMFDKFSQAEVYMAGKLPKDKRDIYIRKVSDLKKDMQHEKQIASTKLKQIVDDIDLFNKINGMNNPNKRPINAPGA